MWTVLATGAIAVSGYDGPGWIGWAFPLFGLPFIAIGLAMMARPFVPLFQKGRVLYVVTNERALKLSMGRELAVETVPADRIGLIQRFEKRDGSGRLQLAVKIGKDSDGDRQTDYFEIGNVADVMGAQEALNRAGAHRGAQVTVDAILRQLQARLGLRAVVIVHQHDLVVEVLDGLPLRPVQHQVPAFGIHAELALVGKLGDPSV